jgi:hypothetical protein
VDAFGRDSSCGEILFGNMIGWNALEEKTASHEDKNNNGKALLEPNATFSEKEVVSGIFSTLAKESSSSQL